MATFYLDYENGDDADDGSDWANAWKTITSGATAARIAPGDTIKIAKSPDPTSLGVNGTWTARPTTLPSAVNILSSSAASPIVVYTSTAHGLSDGDVVSIEGHDTNHTANGQWIVSDKVSTTGNTATYYFNAYSAATGWTNPSNAVNGSTANYAENRNNNTTEYTIELSTNTHSGGAGVITKVEYRAYISSDKYSSSTIYFYAQPEFSGANLGTKTTIWSGAGNHSDMSGVWTSYVDITTDTNAPATWTWADVTALDLNVSNKNAGDNYSRYHKIEIRVTYSVFSFKLSGSTYTAAGGATGTVRQNNHQCVKLASAVTKTVTRSQSAWTAGPNGCWVQNPGNADNAVVEGRYSTLVACSTALAGAQMMCYKTITETDFSGYQQISFTMMPRASRNAGDYTITLCSDTAGATPVDTFNVPAMTGGTAHTFVVNKGSALGSAIKSVAVNTTIALPENTYAFISNIIACKAVGSADSLNLTSLVGKASDADNWYAILSINEDGKVIRLRDSVSRNSALSVPSTKGGTSETTGTVTTYKRETIKTAIAAATSTVVQQTQDSGTSGSNIEFLGGYNTTSGDQDGVTYFDGTNCYGYGLYVPNDYIKLDKINFINYFHGCQFNSSYCSITSMRTEYNYSRGCILYAGCRHNAFSNLVTNYCGSYGLYLLGVGTTTPQNNTFSTVTSNYNSQGVRLNLYAHHNIFDTITANYNHTDRGISFNSYSCNNYIGTANVSGSPTHGIIFAENGGGSNNLIETANVSNVTNGVTFYQGSNNKVINLNATSCAVDATCAQGKNYVVNSDTGIYSTSGSYQDNRIIIDHYASGSNYPVYGSDGGTIHVTVGADRHTASGIAWIMTLADSTRISTYPLTLRIARFAVNANKEVTAKAWVKKSHATNVAAKLICKGSQIAGVASDVTDTKTDDTNYEELSVAFTPTEAGVVEIEVHAWYVSGTGTVYVDDVTLSQAD